MWSVLSLRELKGMTALFAFGVALWASITLAHALDLNAFRAEHGRPALSVSSSLSALAAEQAQSMASRTTLDHKDFEKRIGKIRSAHAENVAVMICARPGAPPTPHARACPCEDEGCAMQLWADSPGHRANMLLGNVTRYGVASVLGDDGKRYWALELGGD